MTLPAGTAERRPLPPDVPGLVAKGAIAAALVAASLLIHYFAGTFEYRDYTQTGFVLVTVVIATVTVLYAGRLSRNEGDRFVRNVVVVALFLHVAGALARYLVAVELYDNVADATRYHRAGQVLAEQFRRGDFDLGSQSITGTRFIEILTGVVYAIAGTSRLAGNVIYGWFAYLGLLLFYRAFRIAVPNGNHRRYALLVLCLPSLTFWPSSIGKEGWMVLNLGLVANGAARYLAAHPGWLLRIALGVLGGCMVRPHVMLLVLAGLALAVAFRSERVRERGARLALAPVKKAVVVAAVLASFVVVVSTSEDTLGVGEGKAESLVDTRNYANRQSTQGGSEFEAQPIRSPLDFPVGAVTVLFRPFPWEARNGQMFVSAVEGVGLVTFCLRRWRSIGQGIRAWRATPYILVVGTFAVGFVWAFSSFGNFGILARQRTQVFPFLFVLLCLPEVGRRAAGRRGRGGRVRDLDPADGQPTLPAPAAPGAGVAAHAHR